MKDLLRTVIAAAVGAVVTLAVVVGQPALASQLDKPKAKKITSAMIKNGTIKRADLNADVNASLVKADTALQSIPNGAVGTDQIAAGSVGSTEIEDGSIGSGDIANASILASDIAPGQIGTNAIGDGTLKLADIGRVTGSATIDFPSLNLNVCSTSTAINSAVPLDGAIILVENDATVTGSVQIHARQSSPSSTSFNVIACNDGGTFDPPSAVFTWVVLQP